MYHKYFSKSEIATPLAALYQGLRKELLELGDSSNIIGFTSNSSAPERFFSSETLIVDLHGASLSALLPIDGLMPVSLNENSLVMKTENEAGCLLLPLLELKKYKSVAGYIEFCLTAKGSVALGLAGNVSQPSNSSMKRGAYGLNKLFFNIDDCNSENFEIRFFIPEGSLVQINRLQLRA